MKDFSDKNSEAISALVRTVKEVMDSLKEELPLEQLDWSFTQEPSDGDSTRIQIWGTGISAEKSFSIYLHPLDSAPEPKELYPADCVATGTLRIGLSEEAEMIELCSSGDDWQIHYEDKWIPFSRSALAFLIGKAQSAPADRADE